MSSHPPLPEHPYTTSQRVAHAIARVLPSGFRGVLRIVVDNGGVKPENVTIEFRPPQPRGGAQ